MKEPRGRSYQWRVFQRYQRSFLKSLIGCSIVFNQSEHWKPEYHIFKLAIIFVGSDHAGKQLTKLPHFSNLTPPPSDSLTPCLPFNSRSTLSLICDMTEWTIRRGGGWFLGDQYLKTLFAIIDDDATYWNMGTLRPRFNLKKVLFGKVLNPNPIR